MSKIALVTSSDGDWEGLYVDGLLASEDHSIPARVVLGQLLRFGVTVNEFIELEVDEKWLDGGTLPELFSGLPAECRDQYSAT